jgi:hypothetical protein
MGVGWRQDEGEERTMAVKVHRGEIKQAIRTYVTDGVRMPGWMLNPQDEHDFGIAMAVTFALDPEKYPGCRPQYDKHGWLCGWLGFRLKDAPGSMVNAGRTTGG